jgi:4-amino-4-deoxy-L-arabinose transferase-like glycosyltransferase
VLVCLAAFALRLLFLHADPATTLTWSGAPFTDEGLYSHAARNQILFGSWRTNEWDNRLVSPLWNALAYGVFKLFGIGFVPLRLISVVFAVAALPLLWDALRRDVGPRPALLATALWAFDACWFGYSRLGLIEPSMVAWLVAAFWCFRTACERANVRTCERVYAVACGICVGIAVVWKSLAIVFVPVPLIALLLIGSGARRRFAIAYLIGLGAVLGVYAIAWYLPNAAPIAAYNRFYAADRVPASLADAGRVLVRNLGARELWAQTPIVLGVGLIGLLQAVRIAFRRTLPPSIGFCVTWLLCGSVLLLLPYSPSRYYLLLLPPLFVLAVWAITTTGGHPAFSRSRALPIAFLIACMSWNGWWYARWVVDRETTLLDGGRIVQAHVPDGDLLLGVHACGLSLAHDHPCAPPFRGLVNDDRPVERLGARYAVVEHSPDDFMRRFYPDLLRRSTAVETFEVGARRVTLYQLQF